MVINRVLLEGTLWAKNNKSAKKGITKILKKEYLYPLGFVYTRLERKFEIRQEIGVGEKFNSDVFLKNLKDKLIPYVTKRDLSLKIYSLEKEINF